MTLNNHQEVKGFLKTEGQKLVNGEGREILLRGVGFGSWLLPEGYMWRFPDEGDRPRRIEKRIRELIGESKAKAFWETYYENYIAEADIRRIAAEGFNSVRVPISARFVLDEEFGGYHEGHLQLIDRVIRWCERHRLYVILDLHGAPGGQTGTNIDDSEHNQPELFQFEENQRRTVDLWRMLAQRYKDEWIVAGYDLLNEPLPEWFSEYNDKVMPLYKDIVKAIRDVDPHHMIILEGVHWATDWSIFQEKIDDHLMLQFHKYWNNPDTESIRPFLNKGKEWDVPIFMGEGGENNKEWYAGVFRLYEDHRISWNFWTWKKLDTDNSPCSIRQPQGWDRLVAYLEGGPKPNEETAERILWDYLDNLLFEHCDYHPEVVRSLFRSPPVRIPAAFYDYEGEGVSFGVEKKTKKDIGFRVNDGTNLQFIEGARSKPNFEHNQGEAWKPDERLCLQLAPGDWFSYAFQVDETAPSITVELRLFGVHDAGRMTVAVDGTTLGSVEANRQVWETVRLNDGIRLQAGEHRVVLQAEDEPIRVEWLDIVTTGGRNRLGE